MGRIISAESTGLVVSRNGQPDIHVSRGAILGKVSSIYWRASNRVESSQDFYIGQAHFPNGDSIEITAVKRTENQMTAKGHYRLISKDRATLTLNITTTSYNPSGFPQGTQQSMEITRGSGDFELIHLHVVPGLPHINMNADGKAFAELYFGTKAEAAEESKLYLSHDQATGDASQLTQDGWQFWQAGKLAKAVATFQQAVQVAPGDANAWNGLGWAQFNSGDGTSAETAFQKAITIEPSQPGALNGLGQIYLLQRRYDDAEKYLLQAAPQAPAAWFGLARLYLLEGKFDQAEKWAQNIVDSGQADETAKKMLDAAKARKLSEGLRMIIQPPTPAKDD